MFDIFVGLPGNNNTLLCLLFSGKKSIQETKSSFSRVLVGNNYLWFVIFSHKINNQESYNRHLQNFNC